MFLHLGMESAGEAERASNGRILRMEFQLESPCPFAFKLEYAFARRNG